MNGHTSSIAPTDLRGGLAAEPPAKAMPLIPDRRAA
jgi:hypothetical protein